MLLCETEGIKISVAMDYFNLKLSRQRAEAVAQFLIKTYSIPPGRLNIVPHGSSQAILPGSASQPGTRRVEFEISFQ